MGAAGLTLTGILKRNLHVMPQRFENLVQTIPIYIDTTLTGLGLSAAAYKILHIEADTLVVGGYLVTDVAEGAAETITIGDVAAANTFLTTTSLNTNDTATAFTTLMKYFAAADEIQITPSAAQGTSKFWVIVQLLKLNKS